MIESKPESAKKVLIITCFSFWCENRVRVIRDILVQKGYSVYVYTSDFDHIKKKTVEKKMDYCEYIHVIPYKNNISFDRIISHLDFGKKINRKLLEINPDIVYALLPPNNVGYVCSKYKKKNRNIRFAIDIIDIWPESMVGNVVCNLPFFHFWRWMRSNSIKNADVVVSECNLYLEKLSIDLVGKRKHVLHLFKDNEPIIDQNKDNKNNSNNKIILGYLGSINHIVDLKSIEELVSFLRDNKIDVEIRVIGDGESRVKLLDMFRNYNCDVKYYGLVFDEEEKYKILNECDFGLNLMNDCVTVGLSIKSIDYFCYGVPLINNLKGDTAAFVEKYNAGINFESSNGCAKKKLIEYIKRKQSDMKFNARRCYDEHFTKSSFQKKVEKIVDDILI